MKNRIATRKTAQTMQNQNMQVFIVEFSVVDMQSVVNLL